MSGEMMTMPWRIGRKVGRTIYAQLGDQPHDRELADHVTKAHNAVLKLQQDWGPFISMSE